jgi:cation-transporting ATPase E
VSSDIAVVNRGLTSAEVADRVQRGLANELPPRSGRTTWDIVRANVFTRINFLLMVLFVMVLSTGSIVNALFGFLIIINSGIGMVQELRAKKTLDNLAVVGEGKPTVRRDGVAAEIPRDQVVLDDLIEIGPGDQVIVDGEVVEASYLEVDESLLTGESDPLVKQPGDEVMSGSFVVAGVGAFRATRVGHDSYAARLTMEASKFSLVKSELQSGINQILRLITWLLIPVGLATVWVQWNQPGTWQDRILATAGALVPMVPEGLVLLTSLAFAVGVVRLGQQNVLVQELPAIEGLARVDVVCADKTGTLTENGLQFGELDVLDGTEDVVRGVLAQLAHADPRPNASVQALAHALPLSGTAWSTTAMAPFTSAKKWSGMSFGDHGNWVLGAPDVLAPHGEVADRAEHLGSSGRRVLLLAGSDRPVDAPDAPGTVTPRALVVLEQKVRPEARDTLAYFAEQDVAVKVISGDNATSVGAVTGSLGVEAGEVVDARRLPEDAEQFADRVQAAGVFGRVTPQQKRQMVAALQSRGHNVAMTGDGVNDVLAIKDSDLGVAMGSGAPATRSVAQLVLLDDSFATLPHVVAEGRRVIGNIERVANFFLTKTMYSIILALLVAVWRLPFPFVPIHISFVGWFTIGIPASILALAPNAERARPGFLQRVMSFSIPSGVAVAVTTFVTYLLVAPPAGADVSLSVQASTATLLTLMIGGAWVMVATARPYQWWKLLMIGLCALAGYLVIFWLPYQVPGWIAAWPALARFDPQLDPSNPALMAVGAWLGLAAVVLVEAIWWISGLVTGERRHVFGSLADDRAQGGLKPSSTTVSVHLVEAERATGDEPVGESVQPKYWVQRTPSQ